LLREEPIIKVLTMMASSPVIQLIGPFSDSRLNIAIRGWSLALLLLHRRQRIVSLDA
jgi:hypothetical protein